MISLNIRLFGKPDLLRGGQTVKGLDAGREQELLCYLLIHRNRAHSRESLAGLLWGDSTTEKSKKYLRQTLWHLQRALEPKRDSREAHILSVEHDWVQLNCKAHLQLDVAEFEQSYAQVQGVTGREMCEAHARQLEAAINLYRGELLEGWYQDWCLFERERLQNSYLSMLAKLLSYCQRHRQFEKGLLYGLHILRYDCANERTHRQLMRLHYLAGDRTSALRQYKRCVSALNEELGVRPSKRTEFLYRQICADQLEEPVSPPIQSQTYLDQTPSVSDADATHAPAISLPEVLGRLKHLQLILSQAEQRIRQDIKSVELGLKSVPQKN
ncbi:MAG: hypothetical protein NVSMB56_13530 [Pyrinomonadaceae bacterium]